MHLLLISLGYDWKQLLLGDEDWSFLPETMLRTLLMFVVILVSLRLLGKRGVKQLSVFELVVIIGLGSAAGDPMFYNAVGILPATIVFIVILILYKLITSMVGKNKNFELMVEGKPVYLIQQSVFSIANLKKEVLGEDEFFAELRMQGVSQLGQIEEAIIESSGNISIFFYPDEDVKYGLPVLPGSLEGSQQKIKDPGYYSCTFCGYTERLAPVAKKACPNCSKLNWVKSSNRKRVS